LIWKKRRGNERSFRERDWQVFAGVFRSSGNLSGGGVPVVSKFVDRYSGSAAVAARDLQRNAGPDVLHASGSGTAILILDADTCDDFRATDDEHDLGRQRPVVAPENPSAIESRLLERVVIKPKQLRGIRILGAFATLMLHVPTVVYGQGCALCYTQAAGSGSRMIAALRSGILILMVPPMLICGGLTWMAYKKRNQFNDEGGTEQNDEMV
jgi:hypothetical protein